MEKHGFFEDKVVWITGASSGIGEGVAYELARHGETDFFSARRVEALEAVRAKCIQNGATTAPFVFLPLDLEELDVLPGKAAEARACLVELRFSLTMGASDSAAM